MPLFFMNVVGYPLTLLDIPDWLHFVKAKNVVHLLEFEQTLNLPGAFFYMTPALLQILMLQFKFN